MSDPQCSLPSEVTGARRRNLHDQCKVIRGTTLLWVISFRERKKKSHNSLVIEIRRGQDLFYYLVCLLSVFFGHICHMLYQQDCFSKVLKKEVSMWVEDPPETTQTLSIPLSFPQGQGINPAFGSIWVSYVPIFQIPSKTILPLSYPPLCFPR